MIDYFTLLLRRNILSRRANAARQKIETKQLLADTFIGCNTRTEPSHQVTIHYV
jgi:hypothetical protein